MKADPKYVVHNMHGPTVHDGDDLQTLIKLIYDMSVNAGPYRIVEVATGREKARCDRDMYGKIRSGSHIHGKPWRIPITAPLR